MHTLPHIRSGLDHLCAHDPVFSAKNINLDDFTWPYYGPGLPGLVRIVLGQQVSTFAANSLWARFKAHVPVITPDTILTLADEDMRALGLSGQKIKYIRNLAQVMTDGSFDPDKLDKLSDEDVHAAIVALHGLGAWSAHMYLMFGLARPDVWAPGDLGIQEGIKLYHQRDTRPTALQAEQEGTRFAPHRTAASLLLWHLKSLR